MEGENSVQNNVPVGWLEIVDRYFDNLESTLDALNESVEDFRALMTDGRFAEFARPTAALQKLVVELEASLDHRSRLLGQVTLEGSRPRSLRAALSRLDDRVRLLRAEELTQRIGEERLRAVVQFVAQFHLAETGKDLVRILTRSGPDPGIYGAGMRMLTPKSTGGGLMDEAA